MQGKSIAYFPTHKKYKETLYIFPGLLYEMFGFDFTFS